jgi:hypothetical protein
MNSFELSEDPLRLPQQLSLFEVEEHERVLASRRGIVHDPILQIHPVGLRGILRLIGQLSHLSIPPSVDVASRVCAHSYGKGASRRDLLDWDRQGLEQLRRRKRVLFSESQLSRVSSSPYPDSTYLFLLATF